MPENEHEPKPSTSEPSPAPPPLSPDTLDEKKRWAYLRRCLVGAPRDLADKGLFHQISLVPFLAWVGLGADGLSSSSYGPEEAFKTLGEHTYLAVALALAVALTIFIISAAYSHIIEQFPHGGGGYVVATKLLGPHVGVVSGCALLVDYVLTITVSIAAAGDAIFNFFPHAAALKLPLEVVLIVFLTILNIRGVKESVIVLLPIFIVFLVTHVVLVLGAILMHAGSLPRVGTDVAQGFKSGLANPALGLLGMAALAVRAYSMGGGTYTGLEAVSNGLPIMREPRVPTAKRTMIYMAVSLAFMASGLLICYLLFGIRYVEGRTMNGLLAEQFFGRHGLGVVLTWITLFAEGALLIVGAQAGFIDGPRVLANMAVDSWVPHRFGALSDRLTTQNGILLMGLASLAALLYTHGEVSHLVVMYSINVFLTFSLSMFGMLRHWIAVRRAERIWRRRAALFLVGFLLCITILGITTFEKFTQGGWVTMAATGLLIGLCFTIRRHYLQVATYLREFDKAFSGLPIASACAPPPPLDPSQPTAGVLIGMYGGTGIHMLLSIFKTFPHYFRNVVFLSVGVIDSGKFKGEAELAALQETTEASLRRYVELAQRLGVAATYRWSLGTEVTEASEKLCRETAREFPHTVFFAGQVMFQAEKWYHRYLHNQTSFNIQKRLHWNGLTMVILPMRVNQ